MKSMTIEERNANPNDQRVAVSYYLIFFISLSHNNFFFIIFRMVEEDEPQELHQPA